MQHSFAPRSEHRQGQNRCAAHRRDPQYSPPTPPGRNSSPGRHPYHTLHAQEGLVVPLSVQLPSSTEMIETTTNRKLFPSSSCFARFLSHDRYALRSVPSSHHRTGVMQPLPWQRIRKGSFLECTYRIAYQAKHTDSSRSDSSGLTALGSIRR